MNLQILYTHSTIIYIYRMHDSVSSSQQCTTVIPLSTHTHTHIMEPEYIPGFYHHSELYPCLYRFCFSLYFFLLRMRARFWYWSNFFFCIHLSTSHYQHPTLSLPRIDCAWPMFMWQLIICTHRYIDVEKWFVNPKKQR